MAVWYLKSNTKSCGFVLTGSQDKQRQTRQTDLWWLRVRRTKPGNIHVGFTDRGALKTAGWSTCFARTRSIVCEPYLDLDVVVPEPAVCTYFSHHLRVGHQKDQRVSAPTDARFQLCALRLNPRALILFVCEKCSRKDSSVYLLESRNFTDSILPVEWRCVSLLVQLELYTCVSRIRLYLGVLEGWLISPYWWKVWKPIGVRHFDTTWPVLCKKS